MELSNRVVRRLYFAVVCGLTYFPLLHTSAYTQTDTPVFGTTVVIPFGLRGLIYFLRQRTGAIPAFDELDPVGVVYTSSLNISPRRFDSGFPGVTDRFEWFAIDYTGRFWIEKPDVYSFALTSDDGSKLFIDGKIQIDNDGAHPPLRKTVRVRLEGGIHDIRVCYFQGPRFAIALVLETAESKDEYRVFSTDKFRPPSDLVNSKYVDTLRPMESLTPRHTLNFQAPDKAKKYFLEGASALAERDLKNAQKHFEMATALYPGFGPAWIGLGRTLEQRKAFEEARDAYEKTLKIDPEYVKAYVHLARLDLTQGRNSDAAQITQRALSLPAVHSPVIYFYDAVANISLKHFDAAEKSARRAVALDMAHEVPRAEYVLGALLEGKGATQEALQHLRAYVELVPHAPDAKDAKRRIQQILEER